MAAATRQSAYERNGIAFPLNAMSGAEAQLYLQRLGALEDRLGVPSKSTAHTHLCFGWAYDLATLAPMLDEVEKIIGPDILVDDTAFFCKAPGDGGYAPWHQDGTYSGWATTASVSAWIALSPSTRKNGCMRVIPGSHLQGRHAHRDLPAGDGLFKRPAEIEVEVDETRALDVELQPGEYSLHHPSIIHGSEENRSGVRRVGFVVRYVTCAFQHRRNPRPAVRARGDANAGLIPILDGRPELFADAAFAQWLALTEAA